MLENNHKSLQNLTLEVDPYENIKHLLSHTCSYVSKADIEKLSKKELELLQYQVSHKLSLLYNNPETYEQEVNKYENILIEKSRNRNWDSNHAKIKNNIESILNDRGRLPTVAELASITNLTRQTVSKHFSEFKRGNV